MISYFNFKCFYLFVYCSSVCLGIYYSERQDPKFLLLYKTGKIDIQVKVDIPLDMELVEQLQEGCIWRRARGAAAEVSGAESAGEKV